MNKTGALLLATSFLVVTAILLPLQLLLQVAQDEERFPRLLSRDRLYELGIHAFVVELENEEFVASLAGTPLELSESDLDRILRDSFSPEALLLKAAETHRSLIDYVRSAPADTIFSVPMREEKTTLVEHARPYLRAKLEALPPCSVFDVGGIGWQVFRKKLSGNVTDEELFRKFPNCKPPDFIAEKIHAGIGRRLDRIERDGPNEVRVFPNKHGHDHSGHRRLVRFLQAADRLLVQGAAGLYLVLAGIMGAAFYAGRTHRTFGLRGGAGLLVLAGMILLLEGTLLRWHVGRPSTLPQLFLSDAAGMAANTRAWLLVTFHAIERVSWFAGERVAWAGAAFGVGGVLLWIAGIRHAASARTRPLGTGLRDATRAINGRS